jgi:hypothetical protein
VITPLAFDPVTEERDMQMVDMDSYLALHPIANKGKFSGTPQGNISINYNAIGNNNNESGTPAALPVTAK